MFWPVVTLISGSRSVSRQHTEELQYCRAPPYMVITSVSVLARSQLLANAGFLGPKCAGKCWCVPREVCMLGWAFLDFLLLGR